MSLFNGFLLHCFHGLIVIKVFMYFSNKMVYAGPITNLSLRYTAPRLGFTVGSPGSEIGGPAPNCTDVLGQARLAP